MLGVTVMLVLTLNVRDFIVMLVLTLSAASHLALTVARRSPSTRIYDLVTVKLGRLIEDDECKGDALR
jgi:hypothetical protein